MTARTISSPVPAIRMPDPSHQPGQQRSGTSAPCLPRLSGGDHSRDRAAVYGVARIDNRGRVSDAAVERALGWAPGARLNIQEAEGVIFVHGDDRGAFAVSAQGHVYLPLSLRRWCGLGTGDQVLLVATTIPSALAIFPAPKLDDLFAGVAIGSAR